MLIKIQLNSTENWTLDLNFDTFFSLPALRWLSTVTKFLKCQMWPSTSKDTNLPSHPPPTSGRLVFVFPARVCILSHNNTLLIFEFLLHNLSHRLSTMAALLASTEEVTANGSWVMSSSDISIPSTAEPRIWLVLPRLNKKTWVTLPKSLATVSNHIHIFVQS